ncbi:cyclophilin-like fold protein [Negativibacillus massiliensis]|uniref:cyclophilin-like fold protein n=1 Tax=Negativibacillus massiliensis TaxID=1871035 RepID=UPI002A81A079|nr:cyclophilin-like fold protein [Negativibacillus massiliensis]MDY4048056.1 cyclophilin-like fold protein [Negativibacillus massiliensis]
MRNSWALMLITCVVCCIFLTACETQSTTDSQQMETESAPQSESSEISEEDEQQIQNEAELPKKDEQESETEEALLSEKEETVPGISQSSQTSDMLKIEIGQENFTATLANNSSVDALKELLKDGPLTLKMSDYAGMEKGADLGVTLPQNNQQMNTTAGDIILYQGRTLVIYYDTNSWSLTPIGKINDLDEALLKETLGSGDVTVTFSLQS